MIYLLKIFQILCIVSSLQAFLDSILDRTIFLCSKIVKYDHATNKVIIVI